MTTLPSNPSLIQLKKQSKDLLKSHQSGDASCCEILRRHHRFKDKSDIEILASTVGLREAQHALALDYGFKGWKALKDSVSEDSSPHERVAAADVHKFFKRCAEEVSQGMPLLRILRGIHDELGSGAMCALVKEVGASVESGHTFSEALRMHPEFDPACVSLIVSGEAAGRLEAGLDLIVSSRAAFGLPESDLSKPGALRYVNRLLLEAVESGKRNIRLSPLEPLPVLSRPADDPSGAPQFQQIINRLKIMSGIDPVTHSVPVEGHCEANIAGRSFEIKMTFVGHGQAGGCEIEINEASPSREGSTAETKEEDPTVGLAEMHFQELLQSLVNEAGNVKADMFILGEIPATEKLGSMPVTYEPAGNEDLERVTLGREKYDALVRKAEEAAGITDTPFESEQPRGELPVRYHIPEHGGWFHADSFSSHLLPYLVLALETRCRTARDVSVTVLNNGSYLVTLK